MPVDDHRRRLLALVLLVGALFGVFVWYGTVTYDPALNDYPGEDDVAPAPEAYVGERVSLDGEVLATDPVVVEVDAEGETWIVTLEHTNEALVRGDDPAVGERLSAHGTLTDSNTLDTDRAYTREPWEWTYMYAISAVGAVWVLGRVLTGWRVDRDQLTVVPREQRLAMTDLLSPSSDQARDDTTTDETADTEDDADAAMAPTAGGERDG
ncbi:hypothetical protein CV102_18200 [Natronococcus pandeyae]|uniref:Uncharacterized protein n=1 Tax=Natronococcus pandeyae TaxID=2055836 RepID=A0A8J8Q4W4_9EURY|nr:hypothetical protein [Natronococcus pandeyae]TYL37245.1 hypothetical protein CV102_18200 [Natronococcus pandeyae]